MTTEQKSNISVIVALTGSIIGIGTLLVKFGGDKALNENTRLEQVELKTDIKAIRSTTDWTKTTLINHISEDDKREILDRNLREEIIKQNNAIIQALGK
jgi:hypothetical protein